MEKLESERQMRNADIYNLATLIRTAVWGKHMPKFDTVFRKTSRKKEMTDEEMYSQVLALNALFGGST